MQPLLSPGTHVLRRGPREVQVGLDPDHALLLPTDGPVLTDQTLPALLRSRLALASLSPASTTERGIPYTTQLSSDSVRMRPPAALIQADPSRPSDPMPVMTTPSTRPPYTSAAE